MSAVIETVDEWTLNIISDTRDGFHKLERYGSDPISFLYDYIPGLRLAPYQEEILSNIPSHPRQAVRGPHGLGKTTVNALSVIWFIHTQNPDTKVPTTASVWRQLLDFLWPEINKWVRKLNYEKMGVTPSDITKMRMNFYGASAFAITSKDPQLIEGAHAAKLLYILDEAKAIPDDIWDAVEGAFSSGTCYQLAASTPGVNQGRFFDIHDGKPGYEDWLVRHVTLDEAIAAGRVSKKWASQRAKQWGKDSALYQNRVLGEFATDQSDGVVSLSSVEEAVRRWYDRMDSA